MNDLAQFIDGNVSLHSDLRPFLSTVPKLGPVLRHPLVYSVPYFVGLNQVLNEQYEAKCKVVQEAVEQGDWAHLLMLYERPWRISYFARYMPRMSDSDYWDMLQWLWQDTENLWQNKRLWLGLLKSKRPERERLMSSADYDRFSQLESEVVIYRGCMNKNKLGLSWTLNGTVAKFFALRFRATGLLLKGTCARAAILACFEGRGEEEVVVEPRKVTLLQVVEVSKEERG